MGIQILEQDQGQVCVCWVRVHACVYWGTSCCASLRLHQGGLPDLTPAALGRIHGFEEHHYVSSGVVFSPLGQRKKTPVGVVLKDPLKQKAGKDLSFQARLVWLFFLVHLP